MSVAGEGLHAQVAVMPSDDDAPADIQPEAGALADGLGREEGLEDPLLNIGGYPRPAVANVDDKLVTVERGPDGQRARSVHRRYRIVDQVGPDLVELAGEARNLRQVTTVVANDSDRIADLAAEHGQRAVQQLVDVDDLIRRTVQLRVLLSGTHERGDAGDRVGDLG